MPLATPTRPMPLPEQLRDFLTDLLGQPAAVDKAKRELDIDPDADVPVLTGVFVDDTGSVAGACLADLGFAAQAGAALAMIPRPVADDAVKQGTLVDNLRDNFYEVANIATSLINGPSVPHIKISELVDGVPDAVRDLIVRAAGRRTYHVTLGDYGTGTFALYAG
ncbi:MAG TPA: hypothetical protein VNQ73_17430 [Ilumatobacter sp.]|nr:hypothetical protein [Ilumatobacter sp.]